MYAKFHHKLKWFSNRHFKLCRSRLVPPALSNGDTKAGERIKRPSRRMKATHSTEAARGSRAAVWVEVRHQFLTSHEERARHCRCRHLLKAPSNSRRRKKTKRGRQQKIWKRQWNFPLSLSQNAGRNKWQQKCDVLSSKRLSFVNSEAFTCQANGPIQIPYSFVCGCFFSPKDEIRNPRLSIISIRSRLFERMDGIRDLKLNATWRHFSLSAKLITTRARHVRWL